MYKKIYILFIALFFIGLVSADTVEFFTTDNSYAWTNWRAQTFTLGTTGADQNYQLRNISLRLDGVPRTVTVYLRAVDGTGKPTGGNLATGSISFPGAVAPGNFYNFSMSDYTLQASTKYAIVVNGGNDVNMHTDSGAGYSGGSLYTSGDGGSTWTLATDDTVFYVFGSVVGISTITTTLLKPENNEVIQSVGTVFNASITGYNVTNATISIWLTNTTIFNRTTRNFNARNLTENLSIYVNSFTPQQYIWNVYGCGVNQSTGAKICSFAPSNYSFFANTFEAAQSFNASSYEGNFEGYNINITYNNTLYNNVIAYLVYNGSRYLGAKQSIGGYTIISKNLIVPSISLLQENKSIYWDITFIGSTNAYFNSTLYNQSVRFVNIDNCTTYTKRIYNYSLYDEDGRTIIVPSAALNTSMDIDARLYSLDKSIYFNFSTRENNKNGIGICINDGPLENKARYIFYSTVQYLTTSRSTEYSTIQNDSVDNSTTLNQEYLFDLTTSTATEFNINVKDENLAPITGAVLEIYRYYPALGLYTLVESPEIDATGNAVVHLILNNGIYNVIIRKNGQIVAMYNRIKPYCNTLLSECKIMLQTQVATVSATNLVGYKNIYYNSSFNKNTLVYNLFFTSIDSSNRNVSIYGYLNNPSQNTLLCSDELTANSGTLTCTISGTYKNNTAYFLVYVNSEKLYTDTRVLNIPPSQYISKIRYLIAGLVIIPLFVMLGYGSLTMSVIMFIIGLIITITLGLLDNETYLGKASIVVWAVVCGMIILVKSMRSENG